MKTYSKKSFGLRYLRILCLTLKADCSSSFKEWISCLRYWISDSLMRSNTYKLERNKFKNNPVFIHVVFYRAQLKQNIRINMYVINRARHHKIVLLNKINAKKLLWGFFFINKLPV